MARRSKLSRDQRRKQKLAKRRRVNRVEPYEGNKYRSERFVEALSEAEIGIYESFVLSDRTLTDHQVRRSLDNLVLELRGEKFHMIVDGNPQVRLEDGEFEDMVCSLIKARWDEFFQDHPRHASSELAGILRSILNSIDCWSRPGPNSRGYLKYLEGFMSKLGVSVEAVAPEQLADDESHGEIADAPTEEPSDEEVLTELGEQWLESMDAMAWKEFETEAHQLLKEGQAGLVIEVCQRLIGEANDAEVSRKLEFILRMAWGQEPPRQPKSGGLVSWVGRVLSRGGD